jgi:hypothetical protein
MQGSLQAAFCGYKYSQVASAFWSLTRNVLSHDETLPEREDKGILFVS